MEIREGHTCRRHGGCDGYGIARILLPRTRNPSWMMECGGVRRNGVLYRSSRAALWAYTSWAILTVHVRGQQYHSMTPATWHMPHVVPLVACAAPRVPRVLPRGGSRYPRASTCPRLIVPDTAPTKEAKREGPVKGSQASAGVDPRRVPRNQVGSTLLLWPPTPSVGIVRPGTPSRRQCTGNDGWRTHVHTHPP